MHQLLCNTDLNISGFAASVELCHDHMLQYLLISRKDKQETGRFLTAEEAIVKLSQGHMVTCSVGVAGSVKKIYIPHADGSVHVREGAFSTSLAH